MRSILSNGYKVYVEEPDFRGLGRLLNKRGSGNIYILCDENTLKRCLPLLVTKLPILGNAEIIEVEAGESNKSVEISSMIWQTWIEQHAGRDTLLINLGGGVISDLGGFTASVYKRGIPFIHIPTTLLAMADASVGGKTALNLAEVKNAIGTFAQPQAVFIHPGFLNTLPKRQFNNGLAEIFKIALVSDRSFWNQLKSTIPLEEMIEKAIRLKNTIVLKDPFDKGLRKILNFGHTIGHALEGLSFGTPLTLLHGEAVLIGMIIESHLAYQKKFISKAEYSEICLVLSTIFTWPSIRHIPVKTLLTALINDKKTKNKQAQFSLLNRIGSCKTDIPVSAPQIVRAIEAYNKLADDRT